MPEQRSAHIGESDDFPKNPPLEGMDPRSRRRVEPRQQIDTRAVIRLVNLAVDIPGRILDISTGGCHIRTDSRFPVGIFRRVETEFRVEGLPFRLAGVTQTIYDPFNVGIRFLDLSDRKRDQLLQLIDEIKAHYEASESDKFEPEPVSRERIRDARIDPRP